MEVPRAVGGVGGLPAALDEASGDGQVGGIIAEIQDVPGFAGRDDRSGANHTAQARHMRLQGVRHVGWRILAPDNLDQVVGAVPRAKLKEKLAALGV